MKLYQIHKWSGVEGSAGYDYFSSRAAAEKAAREWLKDQHDDDYTSAKVEPVEVKMTKAGILSLLNIYASHPNNG